MPLSIAEIRQKLGVSAAPAAGKGVALDAQGRVPAGVSVCSLRMLTADPGSPRVGEFWYRTDQSKLCVQHDAATVKRVTLA